MNVILVVVVDYMLMGSAGCEERKQEGNPDQDEQPVDDQGPAPRSFLTRDGYNDRAGHNNRFNDRRYRDGNLIRSGIC